MQRNALTSILICKQTVASFVDKLCLIMDSSTKMTPQTSLFQVYLRLRPPVHGQSLKQKDEPWLIVEPASSAATQSEEATKPFPTHITLQPPNDSRKRAIERFGFTKIFQEEATQLDVFQETGTAGAVQSVLQNGRDALVATLGVTGSGKVNTLGRLRILQQLTYCRVTLS